ncbi:UNVERIFIED_CONTAM: hypothetical protein GTU68_052118 [Idotea baltica]|nr:hypothetical protein [Idotea baltica]
MDRDNRWDRIEKAYQLISKGIGIFNYSTAKEALEAAYSRQETDEFIQATCVGTPTPIAENDSLIFMNFRADRARELTQSFIDPEFQAFHRNKKPISNNQFAMLTPYSAKLTSLALSAFKPLKLINTLGEFLAHNNKSQLRIAETEKYAHVTFFFSGGKETQLTGEERILIPSPDVSTYDLQPQMSAIEITDRIIESIEQNKHDVIIVNFANADMVGHTGKLDATIQAIECLDKCLARLVKSLQSKNGEALITADHGNAEQMINPKTGQPHTAHTSYPVPLIYVGERNLSFKSKGTLADIAPSFLKLLGFHAPQEMTGKNLIELS